MRDHPPRLRREHGVGAGPDGLDAYRRAEKAKAVRDTSGGLGGVGPYDFEECNGGDEELSAELLGGLEVPDATRTWAGLEPTSFWCPAPKPLA